MMAGEKGKIMKRFEEGTYRKYFTAFDGSFNYTIEKVTEKTVTVTLHKGGKYEKTGRTKIVDCGINQYAVLNFASGLVIESDNEKVS